MSADHDHDHDHAQGHAQGPGSGPPARHPFQPDTEDAAFDDYQIMAEAVGEILIDKGIFGADELRRTIETIDAIFADATSSGERSRASVLA